MSDDNTRRHWHGSPGDRYQHVDVWMNGGAKSPTGRAPWAMPITDNRRVGHVPLWISISVSVSYIPIPILSFIIIPLALHHYYCYPSIHL